MPVVHITARAAKRARLVLAPDQDATEAIGRLEPGFRISGFTKGQFSLLDLIRAIAMQIGPSALTISTWTAGIRDTENVGLLKAQGYFTQLRLLVDRSFPSRQPQYCADVRRVFGDDAIWMTRTHAKFALMRNNAWNVCIRSSMNLNRNPRYEHFDVDDDAELCEFFEARVLEIAELMQPGFAPTTRSVDRAFAASMGGKMSAAYNPNDLGAFLASVASSDENVADGV